MNQYFEWFEISKQFLENPIGYKPENVNVYMDEYESEISNLVTKNYINEHKNFLKIYLSSSGEGFRMPDYDVRFDIIENTPKKVTVKSIIAPYYMVTDEVAANVYVTAIKENGKWLIDSTKITQPPEELVNFTWNEFDKIIKSDGYDYDMKYLGEITMNATIGFDIGGPVQRETKVFLVDDPNTEGISGITASGNKITDIPNELLPENLRPKSDSLGSLTLELHMGADGSIILPSDIDPAIFDSTFSMNVGDTITVNTSGYDFYFNIINNHSGFDFDSEYKLKANRPGTGKIIIEPFGESSMSMPGSEIKFSVEIVE